MACNNRYASIPLAMSLVHPASTFVSVPFSTVARTVEDAWKYSTGEIPYIFVAYGRLAVYTSNSS